MRHHRIAVTAVAALAVITLAACSSSSNESSSSPSPTASTAGAVEATPEASTPAASFEASTPATTSTSTAAAGSSTILDLAASNPDFAPLVAAARAAGLADTLNSVGPFTVFAPSAEAFGALPAGVLAKLLLPANQATLRKVLEYHVVKGKILAADAKAGQLASIEGSALNITTEGGLKVNGASVISTDIQASNGVVHVIDKVLVPPDVDLSKL